MEKTANPFTNDNFARCNASVGIGHFLNLTWHVVQRKEVNLSNKPITHRAMTTIVLFPGILTDYEIDFCIA